MKGRKWKEGSERGGWQKEKKVSDVLHRDVPTYN